MIRMQYLRRILCCVLGVGMIAIGFSGCTLKDEKASVTKPTEAERKTNLTPLLEGVAFDGVVTGFPITFGELPESIEIPDNFVGDKVRQEDLGGGVTYASVHIKRKNDSQIVDIDLIRKADETYEVDELEDKMIWAVYEYDSWEGEKLLTVQGIGIGDSIESVLQVFGEPTEYYKASDEAGREDDPYVRADYQNGEDCISFNSDDGAKISSISICLESVRKKLTK